MLAAGKKPFNAVRLDWREVSGVQDCYGGFITNVQEM